MLKHTVGNERRQGEYRTSSNDGMTAVQQVKIFKSIESEVSALEREINDWIRSSGARVQSIHGNIAPQSALRDPGSEPLGGNGPFPSDVLVIVMYET